MIDHLDIGFQNWKKLGLVINGSYTETYSYTSLPVALCIGEEVLRIYFSSRDPQNRSLPFFIDYSVKNKKVLFRSESPLLELGEIGTFDDSGIMPTCLIKKSENEVWLYYIGWNLETTVPFRNSLGLAISNDGGSTFVKAYKGPIFDRTKNEPYFNASCSVFLEGSIYKMWYLSCVKWQKGDIPRHFYNIKYAESLNGIDWKRDGIVAIDFLYDNEYAISVPRVLKENGLYKMWYSYRGKEEIDTYRIGYAESSNGLDWNRKDSQVGLDISSAGWDSEMICYPFVFDFENERYMLYNGNGYGKTGFGIARLAGK